MKRLSAKIPLTILLLACSAAGAETLILSSGRSISGTVIRTNGSDLMVLTDFATFNFAKQNVKAINGAQGEAADVHIINRFPDFKTVVLALSKQNWSADLMQIPATVIDKGMFQNVPYVSFRCSDDYEINVYGDPRDPAAIEAGVYRKLLGDENAKNNCLRFIGSLLGEAGDREVVEKLSRSKDLTVRNGLTFEITPPTAEDSYQGWWVSVYSEQKLNASRATEKELGEISVQKSEVAKADSGNGAGWSSEELKLARPSQAETISFTTSSGDTISDVEVVKVVSHAYLIWRKDASGGMVKLADLSPELQKHFGYNPTEAGQAYAAEEHRKALNAQQQNEARAIQSASVSSVDSSGSAYVGDSGYSGYQSRSSGSGRVYVHGYTRKDGTYVHSYYRRR